ncbi:hypothetical protein [Streptomyces sp. NPDC050121]|uniref:hypothetical protein n=1 Tax=Streptomyces sp. NPDC050121 TaxID=3365601 RepID=UPI003788EBF7
MPSVSDEALQRLADVAKRRRAVLGLALNDRNAKAAGTSKGTWQRVEKGLKIHDSNYVKIDGLLRWAPGSCVAVLEGGEPVPVGDMEDAAAAGVQKSPLSQDVVDERVQNVVRLALIATAKGTTAEEIREMSERVARDLREEGLT